MAIVIKRTVSLEFLGEDYKDSSLVFKAIPVKEYDVIRKDIDKIQKDNDEEKAISYILELLKGRFIEGTFEGSKVEPSDLGEFPADVLYTCIQELQGNISPKG